MDIKFYDQTVNIKEVTLGSVVFVLDFIHPDDFKKAEPAHVMGFEYNGQKELIFKLQIPGVGSKCYHTSKLAWDIK